jgi:predicted MPP superfamily phosphohydrolase
MPVICPCPGQFERFHDLDVWINELEELVKIAACIPIEASADQIHVLLRHRPRSIPQVQESA